MEWINLPESALPTAQSNDFELDPENLQAWEIFNLCATQWRTSMTGATGLDYTALEAVMRLQRVKPKHHPDLFWRVQRLERGALDAMREQASNGQ